MISDQITHLIEQVKQHPNSESRNSLLGRLKDAHAHAVVLERNEFMATSKVPKKTYFDEAGYQQIDTSHCICPAPVVRDKACLAPIHK